MSPTRGKNAPHGTVSNNGLAPQLKLGLLYQYQWMRYRSHFRKAGLFDKEVLAGAKEEQYTEMIGRIKKDGTNYFGICAWRFTDFLVGGMRVNSQEPPIVLDLCSEKLFPKTL